MNEAEIIKIVVGYLIPTILSGILGVIVGKYKKIQEKNIEEQKKEKAIELGVQALLRNEITRRYREFEIKGEISILDKENLEAMFEQYKNLGGNGTVKKMMTELLNLKTQIVK